MNIIPNPACRWCWMLVLSLLVVPLRLGAGEKQPEVLPAVEAKVVKAAYVYNFTKFVNWVTEDGLRDPALPITICVVGTDPVGNALDEIASLQSQGRPIKVLHVKGRDPIPPCHILYISSSEEAQLTHLLTHVAHASVLTVSDISRFAAQGGMIGFVPERGRIRIEINAARVRLAGLVISSKLLEIARLVPEEKS